MKQQQSTSLLLGLGIIAVGVILLLELLGIVRGSVAFDLLWPVTIFATGLGLIGSKSTRMFGFVVVWVGFLLLLRQLNVFGSDASQTVLALLFALTGLSVVLILGDKVNPPKPDKDKD